ncbi:ABC transporter substrate-binding protein [Vibrio sp. SS-MA-C1-2]|uniref:ABC transporter substrate-binding protein n=1 Tax=Vibrio sp. SS-MA-C1-2 TaxID=2908646 RepID=UPI001F4077D1|nr:ABC transporter substrate-binding protein [Vibrio sp. SS-MA-C1-2]UJF18253.1 ABC transporter substrate-binding protein [Vibrio sp. SS-MA-C1-2]
MKIYQKVGLLLFSSLTLFGCDKSSETREDNHIVLSLDWTPNTNHTGFYVAKELGYYHDVGIDLEIVQPHQSSANQLVDSKQVDFGITTGYSHLRSVDNGLAVVNIATILPVHTSSFYSLAETPLNKVEDFEGKTYVGWSSPLVDGIFNTMMTSLGKKGTDIQQVVSSNGDIISLLEQQQGDFVWGYDGWQGVEAKLRGIDIVTFSLNDVLGGEANIGFSPPEPIIITHSDTLKSNAELVNTFISATRKGFEYAVNHPKKAADLLLKQAPELRADLVYASQEYLSPLYLADNQWGHNDKVRWQQFSDWMYNENMIDKLLTTEQFIWSESYPDKAQ